MITRLGSKLCKPLASRLQKFGKNLYKAFISYNWKMLNVVDDYVTDVELVDNSEWNSLIYAEVIADRVYLYGFNGNSSIHNYSINGLKKGDILKITFNPIALNEDSPLFRIYFGGVLYYNSSTYTKNEDNIIYVTLQDDVDYVTLFRYGITGGLSVKLSIKKVIREPNKIYLDSGNRELPTLMQSGNITDFSGSAYTSKLITIDEISTIVVRFKNVANESVIYGNMNNSSNRLYIGVNGNGNFGLGLGDSNYLNQVSSVLLESNKLYTALIEINNVDKTWSINLNEVTTSGTYAGSINLSSSRGIATNSIAGNLTSYITDGQLDFLAHLNGTLTDTQKNMLFKQPHQFFKECMQGGSLYDSLAFCTDFRTAKGLPYIADYKSYSIGVELFNGFSSWSIASGWAKIDNTTVSRIATGGYSGVSINGFLTVGTICAVVYTVEGATLGGVKIQLGDTYYGEYKGNGTWLVVGEVTNIERMYLMADADFDGQITYLSVKEIQGLHKIEGFDISQIENYTNEEDTLQDLFLEKDELGFTKSVTIGEKIEGQDCNGLIKSPFVPKLSDGSYSVVVRLELPPKEWFTVNTDILYVDTATYFRFGGNGYIYWRMFNDGGFVSSVPYDTNTEIVFVADFENMETKIYLDKVPVKTVQATFSVDTESTFSIIKNYNFNAPLEVHKKALTDEEIQKL